MPSTRRDFVKTLAPMASAVPLAGADSKPNVLVILTDDQGYGDFSCHGNPVLKTPNMDRLHSESVRFTHFHCAPMCTPTRGELLSGVDALRNRATSVTAGRAVLRRDLPTMADIFASNGYRTGVFGKWHLGDNYPYRPMDRGFERAVYFRGWGFTSAPEFDSDYFDGRCLDQGVPKRFTGYCTDFWFRNAMDWMKERQQRKERFLCYLPTNTPHGPAWVAEKYSAPYKQYGAAGNFFGMIANLDENLGTMEAFLRDTGLRDNTVVVFMTDNGATMGRDIYNAGMRAFKTHLYDGGHRVPCFVRWPAGGLRPAGDVDTPAQMQDILPTLIDLCGLKKPASARFDGVSLKPLLTRGSISDRMLVVQYGQIPKQWDSCVIWRKWRLVYGKELYDILADRGQKNDIASANPEVVTRMRAHYEKWWAGVEAGTREFQPISIGSDKENPVNLSCSDWQDIYCDNLNHVSNAVGGPRGGPWRVYVERDGDYEISLFRWPPWQKLPLIAARTPQKTTVGMLPAGKAMAVGGAKLSVAGQELQVKTEPQDVSATLRVKLKAGTTTNLHAWFLDSAGNDLCGAFYAIVRRA